MIHVFILYVGSLQGWQAFVDVGPPKLDLQYLQQRMTSDAEIESIELPQDAHWLSWRPETSAPTMQVHCAAYHMPTTHRWRVPA